MHRIIVVAAPKSGSTFISHLLGRYFDTETPNIGMPLEANHHNLTTQVVENLRGHSFSFNLHMEATYDNLRAASDEEILLIGTWRNLGDLMVSLDDHYFREPDAAGTIAFVRDWARYRTLDRQARYAYLIEYLVPWYVNFYLRWRSVNLLFAVYEQMLLDPVGFFSEVVQLSGLLDLDRLRHLLDTETGVGQRRNIGVAGRSAELFSDENKRRLEQKLIVHPDSAQLEVLLWELPWDVPGFAPGPLEGRMVQVIEMPSAFFFVSRGVRYPIERSFWMAARFGERRTPVPVHAADLTALRLGEALY